MDNYNELHIKKVNPALYHELYKKYPKDFKWMERVYWFVTGLKKHPVCPVCGKQTNFNSFNKGYHIYCSPGCVSRGTRQKMINSQIKKYGPDVFKHHTEQRRKTCMERYGVDNPAKSDEILEKIKATNLKRYGVDCIFNSKEFMEKIHDKLKGRYAMQDPLKKQKIIDSIKWKHDDIIGYTDYGYWICKCPHPKCNKCSEKQYIIKPQTYNGRERLGAEKCTNLFPLQSKTSSVELSIHDILDSMDIQYTTNNRSIINPLELDIYIPDLKLAIEVNGAYWHSLLVKHPLYHVEKFKKCIKNGVRMISIWEDWKNYNLKSLITDLINKQNMDKWKTILYPDLKENEWPCDFGISGEKWNKHISTHESRDCSYECSDCGVITIN